MPPDVTSPDQRADREGSPDLSFGDFVIVRADERLVGPEGPVKLGRKAYRVLLKLAEQDGQLVTKDALFDSVWDGTIVSESALTSVIKELRRALGDPSVGSVYIESVYGRGYRLLPPVVAREARPTAARVASPRARYGDSRRMGEAPLLVAPPFDDKAISATDPHLGAMLHEEVIIALSRFRDIRLVSDAGGAEARTAEHGERDYQLSVRLILHGDDIRAFARITRLAGQSIIWAEHMSLGAANRMQSVEDIARRVAAVALPRLHDDVLQNLPPQPADAYDRYFLIKLRMRGEDSYAEAREIAAAWEQLIQDHPNFAPAYPPLTRLLNTDYCYSGIGSTGEDERRRAYGLAHRAFAIDPNESHLHTVKGWSHLWAGETALALEHLHEAVRLNPYNQNRLVEVAKALMYLDDLDGAAELLERCRQLTPFATETPHEEQGFLHLLRGEFERAAALLALVRRHHPDDPARTEPAIMSELYALLAAAGAGASDVAARFDHWRQAMARRWIRPEPLDDPALKQWVLYHNPFPGAARREWLSGLLDKAMGA
jgi:DNA-binding winged helix-turn-helix (wHTH) protein/tetratricopeptide (TPR) repeat protein